MRDPWASGLAVAAAHASLVLKPDDALVPVLRRLAGVAASSPTDADLAAAIGDAELLFERLATWPAPDGGPADTDDVQALAVDGDAAPQEQLAQLDTLRWLAAVAALEALAAGPEAQVARAFARGACELARGDVRGLGWLLRGVELSAGDGGGQR